MADKKTILVLGGSGMIGCGVRGVVQNEQQAGTGPIQNETWIFVGSRDADLCDLLETKALFEKYKPTHVINLAGLTGGMYSMLGHNADYFRKNMRMTENVLSTCHERGVKKVVSTLTSCIFPNNTTFPIDETMINDGPPHPSIFGYCYGKRMIDVMNRVFHEQYGCMFTSIIPCNVYGPNDNFTLEGSNVIPGLIRKLSDAKNNGDKTYTIWGSGEARRQFIYSEDLGKLILWTLREYNSVEPIILAVDEEEEMSILETVKLLKEIIGFKGELVCDPTKPDGQLKKTASNKKLRQLYPEFKFTKFEDAIRKTVLWYLSNSKS